MDGSPSFALPSSFEPLRADLRNLRPSNFALRTLFRYAARVRWIVRGDIDGFFGLALDNLVQLLLIDTLCRGVLGFPPELVYGRVLPAAAISILVGNIAYAIQARRLARTHGTPRRLRAAVRHQHRLALRPRLPRDAAGEGDRGAGRRRGSRRWWRGRRACSRRSPPASSSWRARSSPSACARRHRARRCSRRWPASRSASSRSASCSGRSRTRSIGLTTLAIVMLTYFGRVRFKGHIPGGIVAVGARHAHRVVDRRSRRSGRGRKRRRCTCRCPSSAICWRRSRAATSSPTRPSSSRWGSSTSSASLQNIESAEAAGDAYDTRYSLTVNGIGSLAAALFGSAFPTTIYIGHPGWKALGARAGYSVLNGIFVTVICVTGTLAWIAWAIPIDAGMAIVLWIGIVIVAQAFQATPREHAPAVVVGLLPGIGAWGALMAKNGLRAAGLGGSRRAVQRIADRRVPEERHLDPRRLRDRAGLPLHRDDPVGGRRRRDRTAVDGRGAVVRQRGAAVSLRTDALVRSGRSATPRCG